jgi:hypothetical protein
MTPAPEGCTPQTCNRCGYPIWHVKLTDEGAEKLHNYHHSGGWVNWTFLQPRVMPGLGSLWMDGNRAEVGAFGQGDLRRHCCLDTPQRCRFCDRQILWIDAANPARTKPYITDTEPDQWGTVVLDENGLGVEDCSLTTEGTSYRLHRCRGR